MFNDREEMGGKGEDLEFEPPQNRLPIIEISSLNELGDSNCLVEIKGKFPIKDGNELFQFFFNHMIMLEDLARIPLVQIQTPDGQLKSFFLYVPRVENNRKSDHRTLIQELHSHFPEFVVTMTASMESFSQTPSLAHLQILAQVQGNPKEMYIQLKTAGDIVALQVMGLQLPTGVVMKTENSAAIVRNIFTDIDGVTVKV